MMMAFDYLDSLRTIEIRIQIKTRQAQHLRDTMSSITAPMDKEQVSHTKNVSAMQDTMAMVLRKVCRKKIHERDWEYAVSVQAAD